MAEEEEVVKSFKDLGLCDQLLEACDNLGWKQPSKIQVEAIPHGLEGPISLFISISCLQILRLC